MSQRYLTAEEVSERYRGAISLGTLANWRSVEAGRALGIAVHDHLVVGRHGVASLKALGLF